MSGDSRRRPCGYRRDLTPIYDWLEVEELLNDGQARRVGYDVFGTATGLVAVSTVHTVIDQTPLGRDAGPVVFESMVFGGDHDGACWRYPNEATAAEGHRLLVDALASDRDPATLAHPAADRGPRG